MAKKTSDEMLKPETTNLKHVPDIARLHTQTVVRARIPEVRQAFFQIRRMDTKMADSVQMSTLNAVLTFSFFLSISEMFHVHLGSNSAEGQWVVRLS